MKKLSLSCVALLSICFALAALLFGCGGPAPTPAQPAATQPTAPTLLQVLETAYSDAQPFIAVASAADPQVALYNGLAGDALNLASSTPTQMALNDAVNKVAALVTHPAVVAAKAAPVE
jgi:hypothetical protein